MKQEQLRTDDNIKNDDFISFSFLLLVLMVVGTVLVVSLAELSGGWYILYLFILCTSVLVASMIFGNAVYHDKHPWIWGICSFLFFPIAPLAYLFSKTTKQTQKDTGAGEKQRQRNR